METVTLIDFLCEPNILAGILFIGISIPLLRGKIPMNQAYGFRIQKAFASNDNWYAINKYGAKQLLIWSSIVVAAGIILLFVPIPPILRVIPLILGTTIAIARTLLFAKTLPG